MCVYHGGGVDFVSDEESMEMNKMIFVLRNKRHVVFRNELFSFLVISCL